MPSLWRHIKIRCCRQRIGSRCKRCNLPLHRCFSLFAAYANILFLSSKKLFSPDNFYLAPTMRNTSSTGKRILLSARNECILFRSPDQFGRSSWPSRFALHFIFLLDCVRKLFHSFHSGLNNRNVSELRRLLVSLWKLTMKWLNDRLKV